MFILYIVFMDFTSLTSTENDCNRRLDRIIRKFMPEASLSHIYSHIRKGLIRVNNKKTKPHIVIHLGDTIQIASFLLNEQNFSEKKQSSINLKPEYDLVLETQDLLVINKPIGISVHGENSLDSKIPQSEAACSSLSFKSGPLHRLDKNTSGLIVFSKTLQGAQWFSKEMQDKTIIRKYLGIVKGDIKKEAEYIQKNDTLIQMHTLIKPLISNTSTSLVEFTLMTGKKHQIRKQSAIAGHPLLGDVQYNGINSNEKHYFLHAYYMEFTGKIVPTIPKILQAPLPDYFEEKLKELFKIKLFVEPTVGSILMENI